MEACHIGGVTRFLGLSLRPVSVDRVIYATITLMSVLIIYDGWQHLKMIDVDGVIVGPVVAMFLAHVCFAAIAQQVEPQRPISGGDWIKVVRAVSRLGITSSGGPGPSPFVMPRRRASEEILGTQTVKSASATVAPNAVSRQW
jgi:hypothetical protein